MSAMEDSEPSSVQPSMFADGRLQAHYDDLGWARFSLVGEDLVEELRERCLALYPAGRSGITFANVDEDRRFLLAVHEMMTPIWQGHLGRVMPGHRVLFTTCVVKHPDEGSLMSSHEDGTFVDERQHRSVTLWLPLVDCREEDRNGMIQVVPRSHRIARTYAGTNVPEWHRPYRAFLTRHLQPVPTRAGECVVWDSRLLHGSPANRSDAPRVALIAALAPVDATLVHVEALGRTRRRMLAVDEAFHLDHSPIAVRQAMPDYPELRRFSEPATRVAPEQVAEVCGSDEVPRPVVDRPADDWFPPEGRNAGAPRVLDGDEEPLETPVDRWSEVALDELRPVGSALAGDRVGSWKPLRSVGEWTVLDLLAPGPAEPLEGVRQLARADGLASAVLFALHPGASLQPPPGSGPEVCLPLTTPSDAAGVATAGGAANFELGVPIVIDAAAPRQYWNGSGEVVRGLLLRSGGGGGERSGGASNLRAALSRLLGRSARGAPRRT